MSEIVQYLGQSGVASVIKKRAAIDFGSIPSPFVKEVTVAFAEADAGDLVTFSPAQALAAGVIGGAARVTAAGVVGIQMGTTGGATLTPNTITLDIYVTKGTIAT